MTISKLRNEAIEAFGFILVFCPDFPKNIKTTVAAEFDGLFTIVDAVMEKSANDEDKQWLRICRQEVQESRNYYEAGNRDKGMELIQRAQEHFKNTLSKKNTAPRFVTGESGAAQDSDSGFPS